MHMTLKDLLLAVTLLLPVATIAQDRPDDFTTRIPIETGGNAPYYRVPIPLAAYLHSAHADLRDLRVFNASGQAVPFARLASTGRNEENTRQQALRWFPLYAPSADVDDKSLSLVVRQSADGTLVELNSRARRPPGNARIIKGYVLDASTLEDRGSVRALDIDWAGSDNNFQLLDVETSTDLQNWQVVRSGVQLARLDFQGARIERKRIDLGGLGGTDGRAGRYLRLVWREPGVAPQLTAVSVEQSSTRWRDAEPVWSQPLQGTATRTGAAGFTYRLPHALPATRLRFTLPEGNVVLPVDILRPGHDRQPPQLLERTVLYRIESKGRQWTQDEVILPALTQALDELTVRVDPRSAPPTQAPGLSFGLTPDQVVFLASGKGTFVMAVGNTAATHSALDASTLVPGFGSPQAPEIAMAVARPAAASVIAPVPGAPDSTLHGKTIALWSVLGLGVFAMAIMAFQLLRQMKRPLSDKN